jgi:hypothetical protein
MNGRLSNEWANGRTVEWSHSRQHWVNWLVELSNDRKVTNVESSNGPMNGRTNGRMVEWLNAGMLEWSNGRTNGRMVKWSNWWNGWMVELSNDGTVGNTG